MNSRVLLSSGTLDKLYRQQGPLRNPRYQKSGKLTFLQRGPSSQHRGLRCSAALLASMVSAPAKAADMLQSSYQQLSTIAEAVAANPSAAEVSAKQDAGWLTPIVNTLDQILSYIQVGLNNLHVPYSYGWSIILLTLLTKVITFPFTKIQVESAISVQKLKPTVDAIKRQYGEDKGKIQRETSALYEKAGVNPLAGCGPSLATIPVFWGLYRTLSNVANEGLLTEGFFWIPSLSGPISLAEQKAGGGSSWLYPFVDGVPPIGWDDASRYLVLPVLLVVFQFVSTAIISPPVQQEEEKKNEVLSKTLNIGLPFMVGWFALNLPAGLSLYYFSNITLTSAQQIWLRKLGGAKAFEWKQEIGINQARRNGEIAVLASSAASTSSSQSESGANAKTSSQGAEGIDSSSTTSIARREMELRSIVSRRCKRKKQEAATAQ